MRTKKTLDNPKPAAYNTPIKALIGKSTIHSGLQRADVAGNAAAAGVGRTPGSRNLNEAPLSVGAPAARRYSGRLSQRSRKGAVRQNRWYRGSQSLVLFTRDAAVIFYY